MSIKQRTDLEYLDWKSNCTVQSAAGDMNPKKESQLTDSKFLTRPTSPSIWGQRRRWVIFLPFSSLRAFLSFDSAIVEKNDKEPGGKEGAKARAREGAEGARHQVRRRRGRERGSERPRWRGGVGPLCKTARGRLLKATLLHAEHVDIA